MTTNPYAKRKTLRVLEKLWTRLEGLINRFTKSDFNPFYHLGTLTIFMLIVLIITGAYLTIIYRPGLDVAYATVDKINSNWFGVLIRSIHRYASDAIILLIILHFLKMLVSDRYWGQRWLAWTSGWIMLAVTWLTGTMGYWLIWDQRAQWMTEYMMRYLAGSSGLTYVSPDLAARTFSNFVIILFLHVFLPIITFFAIYIHSLRLSRARWWSPRWVSIQAIIGLILISIIKPVSSFAQADLSTLVKSTPMDYLYLGFIPLAEVWGNVIIWGLTILVGGTLFLLPWLARGRDLGPAVITNEQCTGCNICYAECPFDAIRMIPRHDESGYNKLAIINNKQCTACGICVGSCPTDAIDLEGGYNAEQTFNALKGTVHRESKEKPVTVLFASHRDQALGGLPDSLLSKGEGAGMRAVSTSTRQDGVCVVTAILPSSGAANIEWIKSLPDEGARDVVILTNPYDDNVYREDTYSILNRLHLRPALANKNIHILETTPGDSKSVTAFLDNLHKPETQASKQPPAVPPVKDRNKLIPSLVSSFFGTILLLGLFAIALPLDIPSSMQGADQSGLRIALDAKGKIEVANIPEGVTLPEGADPVKIFGGEHFPISIRVIVDENTLLDQTYKPSGVSGNGRISALEFLQVESGTHQVEVWIKDDANGFRKTYGGMINFEKGKILILAYDEKTDGFILR